MKKSDIFSPTDITKLIKTFYDTLLISSIKHHFVNLDLEHHLPKVELFWNATLFPQYVCPNNMMQSHSNLILQKEEFKIWLQLFWESIDELFSGANAELMKNRAASIAYIMQKKLLKD